jgi:hypothetical protein
MAMCGTCRRHLPEDPNELDEIIECQYCDEIFCSEECLADHETKAHAEEALPLAEEDEERR